jgi:hypothetical protein
MVRILYWFCVLRILWVISKPLAKLVTLPYKLISTNKSNEQHTVVAQLVWASVGSSGGLAFENPLEQSFIFWCRVEICRHKFLMVVQICFCSELSVASKILFHSIFSFKFNSSLFFSFWLNICPSYLEFGSKNGNFSFLNFSSSKSSCDQFLCFPGSCHEDTSFQNCWEFVCGVIRLRWCIFWQNPYLIHHLLNTTQPTQLTQLTQLTQINLIKPDR